MYLILSLIQIKPPVLIRNWINMSSFQNQKQDNKC